MNPKTLYVASALYTGDRHPLFVLGVTEDLDEAKKLCSENEQREWNSEDNFLHTHPGIKWKKPSDGENTWWGQVRNDANSEVDYYVDLVKEREPKQD